MYMHVTLIAGRSVPNCLPKCPARLQPSASLSLFSYNKTLFRSFLSAYTTSQPTRTPRRSLGYMHAAAFDQLEVENVRINPPVRVMVGDAIAHFSDKAKKAVWIGEDRPQPPLIDVGGYARS
jgi:hypothetical protein